jgi:hypothetical protein
MKLPQELVDWIIDAVVSDLDLAENPWSILRTPDVLQTLRACSLVAQPFVRRSQIHIFHGIAIEKSDTLPTLELFSTILLQRPHLAPYVRALDFEFRSLEFDFHLRDIPHILTSVTNLERLDVRPEKIDNRFLDGGVIRQAFLTAFALPYLRHLTIWHCHFDSALTLQAHFGESTSLKTLALRSIDFDDHRYRAALPAQPSTFPPPAKPSTSPPPRVVLDTLKLFFLDAAQVQEMLDVFTVIDITHLRSLCLDNTPMNSLLRVNAATLQRLKIGSYFPGTGRVPPTNRNALIDPNGTDEILDEAIDPGALTGVHGLQALDLQLPSLASLNRVLRRLGYLGDLMRLSTVTITVSDKTQPAEWQALDALLDSAPALAEVTIYSGSRWIPDEPEPAWLPMLASRDVLRIHQWKP